MTLSSHRDVLELLPLIDFGSHFAVRVRQLACFSVRLARDRRMEKANV